MQLSEAIATLRAFFVEHHDIEDRGAPGEHPTQGPNWAMKCSDLCDEMSELIPADIAKERAE